MTTDNVQELDKEILEAKKFVDIREALVRLSTNRDFKKVIQEGFFEKEAIRLVHLKADPAMQKPESQVSILRQIDAIGALSSYLNLVHIKGNQSECAIESMERMREEILAEDA